MDSEHVIRGLAKGGKRVNMMKNILCMKIPAVLPQLSSIGEEGETIWVP